MRTDSKPRNEDGITLRCAALVAGVAYLLSPVSIAEYFIYPQLVVAGDISRTAQNIAAHADKFLVAISCYLISFIGDIVIAWALYILLAPVNRSLSLITAWFQLVYAAIAFFALSNLIVVYRLVSVAGSAASLGPVQLHAHLRVLLESFRSEWSMGLVLFGIHLVLLGFLIYRSGYVPKVLGVYLVVDGFGWILDSLRPYLFPNLQLKFLFVTFLGELFFMIWLLARGRKLKDCADVRASLPIV